MRNHRMLATLLVASILENPGKLKALPKTQGFLPQHRQAALEGINFWKAFEKEGLFSFELTDNPMEADIHVFWVNHFVNRLGLALFSNDIRGYTGTMRDTRHAHGDRCAWRAVGASPTRPTRRQQSSAQ